MFVKDRIVAILRRNIKIMIIHYLFQAGNFTMADIMDDSYSKPIHEGTSDQPKPVTPAISKVKLRVLLNHPQVSLNNSQQILNRPASPAATISSNHPKIMGAGGMMGGSVASTSGAGMTPGGFHYQNHNFSFREELFWYHYL